MNAPKPKLDIDTTRERLVALGCSHAAEYLDQVLSDAVRQEIAPHAFLDLLLETELSGREARRVKTSLRLSNLPTGQTWRTSTSPTGHLPLRPRSAHTELISLERCDKVPPAIVRSFGRIRSRARREHSPGTCRRLLLSFRDTSRYKVLASHTASLPTDLPDPLRVRYASGGVHRRRWLPRLVVVSNRVAAPDPTGKGAAGGLAVAVREALRTHGGLWFGWSGKVTAEPDAHPKIIDKRRVQYALMDLRPIDRQEYYNGFANRALWPTMHYRMGLSEFSRADLAGYLRVNRTFASALARLLRPDDLVWVHDYHLIPLATELRALGAANPIGYFHHIPWPAPEVFGTLPGSRELLRAVADYDLVGVQTEQDADNLRRGLVQELGAAQSSAEVLAVSGRRTRVKSFPIGIDVKGFRQAAERVGPNRIVEQVLASLGTRKLIIGVDRLDYSKGIPERMQAFERFLVSNPDQRGLVTYLQIAPKTRGDVPEYATLSRAVNQTLGRINGGLGEPGWVPIHYVTSTYTRPVLARLCRLARIGLVTPMRDGMNLVAKEYIAAQDAADPGVLILSKFAGAAQQLTDALIVNPSDKFEVAQAIREGLHMSRDERVSRWEAMFRMLGEQDVTWWAATYVRDLAASKLTNPTHRPMHIA